MQGRVGFYRSLHRTAFPWLCIICFSLAQASLSFGAPPTKAVALIEQYDCARCHEVGPGIKDVPFEAHCVHCHQSILRGELDSKYTASALKKWKKNIRHFIEAPSLYDLSKRLQKAWFISYIQKPHIVRPLHLASMPKMKITESEAKVIASYWFEDTASEPIPDIPFQNVSVGGRHLRNTIVAVATGLAA